ncbi:13167_t:CDS:2 [Cetraspora pellucida]|uniref:13167_t:CDS:1 n=1 Tax=Cetraspora pellucida TaxID=1433469 RepID=A0A9N9HWB2_9GLOM|nr:13167_t:CDS:2 [Cetraspora pellucida]
MRHFKPVLKTPPSVASSSVVSPSDTTTSNKATTNAEVETLPGSTPQNTNNDTQTKVSGKQKSVNNAATQKNKKTQKISDADQVKKAYSRKKKINAADAATPSDVSPETTKTTTTTRKRKSKKEQKTQAKTTETSSINADVSETTSQVVTNNGDIQQPPSDSVSSTTLESSVADNQAQSVVPVKAPRKRKSKVVTATANDTKKEMNNDGESVEQSKPKRVKKAKDPNAPKKPPNAYMQFSKIKRPEIKKENPDANPKEILTLIGEAWRKMSEEERKPYQDMVKVAMIEYEEQMKSYKGLCSNSPVDGQVTMQTPDAYTPNQPLDNQEINQQNILDTSVVPNDTNQSLSGIMVCDSSRPDLSQLTVHQPLSSGVSFENYESYGHRDDMEALLDMPDVGNSYEFQTNDPSLYNNSEQLLTDIQNNGSNFDFQSTNSNSNNVQLYDNSAYQFPATMLPLAMNIQENQDARGSYFYGEQQPQVVKQDLLLYETPVVQENNETSESGSSQEVHSSPVIVKKRENNSGNLLLCQPFEPSNGNNNISNIDMEGNGHWFQDETQYQDPANYAQQFNEYQQVPHEVPQQKLLQDNSRQISRQEYYQKQMSQHHQQQMASW